MPQLSKIINEVQAAETSCIACKAARGVDLRHMTAHANAAVRAAANAACLYDAYCKTGDAGSAAAACVARAIAAAKEAGQVTKARINNAGAHKQFKCATVSLELKAPRFDTATMPILIDAFIIAITWAFCASSGLLSQ